MSSELQLLSFLIFPAPFLFVLCFHCFFFPQSPSHRYSQPFQIPLIDINLQLKVELSSYLYIFHSNIFILKMSLNVTPVYIKFTVFI